MLALSGVLGRVVVPQKNVPILEQAPYRSPPQYERQKQALPVERELIMTAPQNPQTESTPKYEEPKEEIGHVERELVMDDSPKTEAPRELKLVKNRRRRRKSKKDLRRLKMLDRKLESVKMKKLMSKYKLKKSDMNARTLKLKVKNKKVRSRMLWNWWAWYRNYLWRRRQAEIRRQRYLAWLREMARRRRERRRFNQQNIRNALRVKQSTLLLNLQRSRLRQMDRTQFDKLMENGRKVDAEHWNRTFIYDAILLTEKILYVEHDKLYKTQNKVAGNNEVGAVKELDEYYAKNAHKRMSELTEEDIQEDLFM